MPNASAPGNEINGFSSTSRELSFPSLFSLTLSALSWQVRAFPLAGQASTHFSVNCSPHAIGPNREPGAEASLPRILLGKDCVLTQNTKRLLSCRCSSTHHHQHPFLVESCGDYSLHFSASWSQHRAVTLSAADTNACAKLRAMLHIVTTPNTYTAHARTRWRHCLLTRALLKHQAARSSSQKSAKRAMFQCNAQCNTT